MIIRAKKTKSHLGYYFIILAAALSSLIHIASKPILEIGGNAIDINPIVMVFLIYMICGIFFTPIARNTDPIRKFSQKDIIFMILIGLSEVAALSVYFFGLQNSTAVNASIFSNGEILFSLIIAMVVFKEKLHIKEYIPFSIIIVGMLIIPVGSEMYQNGFDLQSIVMGDLLLIISGLLYAVDITICKYIGDRYDSRRVTQITSFFCAMFALGFLFLLNIPIDFELIHLPNLVIISVLGTGMSTLLFLAGLKLIGAVRTVLLYSTASIFGVIFAGLFLSEEITSIDVISIVITLAGIFLLRNRLAESESGDKFASSEQNFVSLPFRNKNTENFVPKTKTFLVLSGLKEIITHYSVDKSLRSLWK